MKVRRGRYRFRANRLRSNFKKFSSWGAILLLSTAWLVVPFAAAEALEVAIEEPIVGPSPPELPFPLPEDPVQEVVDTVNGIINPPPSEEPPPPNEDSDQDSSGGGGSSTSDSNQTQGGTAGAAASGATSAGSGVVNDVASGGLTLAGSAGPTLDTPVVAATSLAPAAFPDYENAKGSLGPFEYAHMRSSGSRSTLDVLAILEDLDLSTDQVARILAPFPVAGRATYSDDWQQARFHPTFHLHEGTDIFAERGTPVIASANGTATDVTLLSDVGGTSLKVEARDGTYYYYGHLERLSPFIFEGKSLTKGEIIGYVGTSGNAEGGPPHLHYEIHPYGGAAVPPVPYLDRWITESLQAAQALKAHPVQSSLLGKLAQAGQAVARVAEAAVVEPLQRVANISTAAGWGSVLVPILLWWLLKRRRRRAEPMWLEVSGP